MSKYIVDDVTVKEILNKWQCGEMTKHIIEEIFKVSKEVVMCEDCDMSKPPISPYDKNYVRCTYLASGDGKYVCKTISVQLERGEIKMPVSDDLGTRMNGTYVTTPEQNKKR